MKKRIIALALLLISSFYLCSAEGEQSEIKLSDRTQAKEIGEKIAKLESVKIDIDRIDVSWRTFLELLGQAATQSKEVLVQSGPRALVFSFTRPWRKEVHYSVIGRPVEEQAAPKKDDLSLVACEFDAKGKGKILGKENRIEDYLKTNPNQRVVILCFFPDDMRLNEAFRRMFQLAVFENVIDFTFPAE